MLLQDPSVSALQCSRKIFDSLLPPAADMIKHLRPDTLPAIYLQTLDSAFSTVKDGEELRIYRNLSKCWRETICISSATKSCLEHCCKERGILEDEVNKHLLSQFCRRCWNDPFIGKLQLKQKKSNPPSFSELLLLLHTEEDCEAAKVVRMKQHLGPSKPKASAQAQYAFIDSNKKDVCATLTTITQQLAKIQ